MRRLALLAALGLVVGTAPAARADQTVQIASFSFSPASLTASLGEIVTFDNTASVGHTSTSDDGFWDTGTLAGGASQDMTFVSAGTFPYHCAIHPSMDGVIVLPIAVNAPGPVTAGTKLTIRFASEHVDGRTYVVQRKRGAKPWRMMSVDNGATSTTFTPKKPGKFRFRAAVVLDGVTSAFSPKVTVKVTAA